MSEPTTHPPTIAEHGQQRKVDGEHVQRVAPVEPARAAALGRACAACAASSRWYSTASVATCTR